MMTFRFGVVTRRTLCLSSVGAAEGGGSSSRVESKAVMNAHRIPEDDAQAIEDRFRMASWDEYESLVGDKRLLSDYSRRSVLLTKNRRLEQNVQLIFAAAALLAVPIVAGYITNHVWKSNRTKQRMREARQEQLFFKRNRLDNFILHDPSGQSPGLVGQAELVSSREDPFLHFLRINVQQPTKTLLPDPDTSFCLFIPASERSQVYINDNYSLSGGAFSFQSPLELNLRLKEAQVDMESRTIFIPKSAGSCQKGQTFPVDRTDSVEYTEFHSWCKEVFAPLLGTSLVSGLVSYYVSKKVWRQMCRKSGWITKAICSPWREGFFLGGRVSLITSAVVSLLSFVVIYGSYRTKTLYFENSAAPEIEVLEQGSQLLQVPTMGVIFILGSVLLSSFFTLPLGAITGRIVAGILHQEMVQILPRATIAIRRFARSSNR